MGEVENISPGLTRTFLVELAEPGAYQTACKPGMVGDGIRAAFTVTGASAAPKSDDQRLAAATAEYQRYVASQSDAFLAADDRRSSGSSRPARSTRPRRSTRRPAPTGSASSRWPSPSATSTR